LELAPGSGGERRQVTKGGYRNAKAAADARAEVIRRHRADELGDDTHKTLAEWLPEWLAGREERDELSENSLYAYREAIKNHLIPKLGHRKLSELRGLDITRAYSAMRRERQQAIINAQALNARYAAEAERINAQRRAQGLKPVKPKRVGVPRTLGPVSIERIHACLSKALKAARKAGLIRRNPAADADLPKRVQNKVVPPEPERYGAFLDAVEADRLYPLWVLMGYSGLRRGEACGLMWLDVDLSSGRLVVARSRVAVNHRVVERGAKTDAGQRRVVYLDDDALDVLKAWRKAQDEERLAWGDAYQDGGYVFTRENGEPLHPNHVTKRYARLAAKHGMAGTKPHTLRHFRASALISSGADITAVSKTLGHKSISVTSDIYGHLFEKAAKDAAEKAAGFVPRRASE
jgi:integrase